MDISKAFKLFDIRGDYPSVVDEQLAFALGSVLSSWKIPKNVAIAGDIRNSTPSLKKYLIDGFNHPVEIFDLGEVPIPEFYYTVKAKHFDLGVMITASHLHANDNGFKIVGPNALPFDESELIKLKKLVSKHPIPKIVVPKKEIHQLDETANYVSALLKFSNLNVITLKLVLDITRSSASTVVPLIFTKLAATYDLVKSDHEGNPLLEQNRADLSSKVLAQKAALGIIWDTDGDRVAFVDSKGQFIPMSIVLAILGAAEVRKNAGGKVAIDVRAGLIVRDEVEKAGGTMEIFPAWHPTLKFAMQEDPSIVFAGENSGHIIYRDFYSIDDGIFAALKFIDFSQNNDLEKTLEHLNNRYFELPEMNFKVAPEKTVELLETLANNYRAQGHQISLIDGLTVFGPDWKFNLRESATEPLLRLNLEAKDEQKSKKIMDTLTALL